MSADVVVQATALGKRFKLYSGPGARLLDWLHVPPGQRYEAFWAVRDVSFSVERGECLGIIGPNGAGKSTLLKLLTRSLLPTSGELRVSGRVLSLLELGTGFNPELTGRENVRQSATLLGFPPGYAHERMAEIEAFAGLGDYFDRPVKQYSSGMFVRLAFALFSAMEPEVFLVDEALAIGDLRFSGRALGRIRQMLAHGTTLLFVSHDLQLINQLCSRAIWLHGGRVQMDGLPADVTRAYQQFVVHGQASREYEVPSRDGIDSTHFEGSGDREIFLGAGWYPLEAFAGQVFRWAGQVAEIVVAEPTSTARELLLEVEPGPSAGPLPVPLEIDVAEGPRHVQCVLTGRETIRVLVPASRELRQRLRLRAGAGSARHLVDGRDLSLRLHTFGWSDAPAKRPVQEIRELEVDAAALELAAEQSAMAAALRRCRPAAAAKARVVGVITRRSDGTEAVRFAPHQPLAIEVTVEGLDDVRALVVGVQVRDAHDRMITGTRLDWLTVQLPALAQGDFLTLRFATDDLPLGRGLYQLTVGCHEYPNAGQVFHWVDGAWRFEVVEPATGAFVGQVDLGLHYSARTARPTTKLLA